MTIHVVTGISNAGKSHYIQKNKQPEDNVLDIFDYQHKKEIEELSLYRGVTYAFYWLFADIEVWIRRKPEWQKKDLWVEIPMSNSIRRKLVFEFLDNMRQLYCPDAKIVLYHIDCSDEQAFINRYQKRFKNVSVQSAKTDWECRTAYQDDNIPWDEVIKYDSGAA